MMTVHEVSRLAGVSVRTLQYYDRIGLLHPAERTEAGYRLYDAAALETLQQILLYRELAFPLKDIRRIIRSPAFDREKALDQQIELLRIKKAHLESLISLACRIRKTGGKANMDFSAFDTKKMDAYAAQAKASWGATGEYHEFEQKSRDRTQVQTMELNEQMMQIFAAFGAAKEKSPASGEAQSLVRQLQDFITEHFYTCSDQILASLGQMYAGGGEMSENIDSRGGEGTAAFAGEAIRIHCAK